MEDPGEKNWSRNGAMPYRLRERIKIWGKPDG